MLAMVLDGKFDKTSESGLHGKVPKKIVLYNVGFFYNPLKLKKI